ncbi:MAG: GH25 family lysozyme [Kofleriaceae bacterium]
MLQDASVLFGVDLVSGSERVDWDRMRASGRTFAYAQAGSRDFAETWEAMRTAGILRGAWHLLRDDEPAIEQAIRFLRQVELQPGDLPPALDITAIGERSPWSVGEMMRAWLGVVESELEARHGHAPRPIIRTHDRAWRHHRDLDHHAVWVIDHAQYDRRDGEWMFHQYAGATPGMPDTGSCRFDRFNAIKLGDRGKHVARLKQRLGETRFRFGITETDVLDPPTRDAIVRFQASRELLQDGIVGPKTYAELEWS